MLQDNERRCLISQSGFCIRQKAYDEIVNDVRTLLKRDLTPQEAITAITTGKAETKELFELRTKINSLKGSLCNNCQVITNTR